MPCNAQKSCATCKEAVKETAPTKDKSYKVRATRPGIKAIGGLIAFAVLFVTIMTQIEV